MSNINMVYFKKWVNLFLGVISCITLDQVCKSWIQNVLLTEPKIHVSSFFTIVYAWNPGISFGLFPCYSALARHILVACALCFVLVLLVWYFTVIKRIQRAGLVMMMGGALGNIIDRITHGAVFDFLSFHWGVWQFPAFNVADMLITGGFLLLLLDHGTEYKKNSF